MTPKRVFRAVAITEAITWAALLTGMFLKYVPETTELGVRIAGPIHGVAFLAYCLATVVVAVDQQWSRSRTVVGLLASIPPLATVVFDRAVEKRGGLDDRWHSHEQSETRAQRLVCWFLRHWVAAGASAIAVVAGLTAVALAVGPPVG